MQVVGRDGTRWKVVGKGVRHLKVMKKGEVKLSTKHRQWGSDTRLKLPKQHTFTPRRLRVP